MNGWSMSQYLPNRGFEWGDATQLDSKTILALNDETHDGFIFEVDLHYPSDLHELHNEYPLAPQRMTVTKDMLSSYAKSLLNRKFKGTPKLITSLEDKLLSTH